VLQLAAGEVPVTDEVDQSQSRVDEDRMGLLIWSLRPCNLMGLSRGGGFACWPLAGDGCFTLSGLPVLSDLEGLSAVVCNPNGSATSHSTEAKRLRLSRCHEWGGSESRFVINIEANDDEDMATMPLRN
jgi:hypothetical protein